MSRLRWALVALLVVSTVLFAVGVIAERSDGDTHADAVAQQAEGTDGEAVEPEGAHDEAGESGALESEEGHGETASGETGSEDERVLGVDLESTPMIVLAVIAGLGLAALTATRLGRLRGFLLAVTVIALLWAALDVREVIHQLDESRTGIAVVAMTVAVLHVAAAVVSGRLARQPGTEAR
jgi:hypothetical protein